MTARILYIFTVRKRSLGQGNIFTPVCHSVHRGGACVVAPRGACVVALRGVHGCSRGACMVALGGVHGCSRGGMHGCSGGACMVALGGACVVAPRGGHTWLLPGGVRGCSWGGVHGIWWDMEIRSMSGRYTSYWNAFLLSLVFAYGSSYWDFFILTSFHNMII